MAYQAVYFMQSSFVFFYVIVIYVQKDYDGRSKENGLRMHRFSADSRNMDVRFSLLFFTHELLLLIRKHRGARIQVLLPFMQNHGDLPFPSVSMHD